MSTITGPDSWKILMIDDDEDDFFLVRAMLAGGLDRKIRLEWANGYAAGQQALQVEPYDAVLMDYDLGQHTGLELIRQASAQDYPGAFILYTGRGSREIDLEALQAGASMYLTKGETSALMLERGIRYAIERKRSQRILQQNEEDLRRANAELKQELQAREEAESELKNNSRKLQVMFDREKLLSEAAAELLAGEDPIQRLDAFFERVSDSLGLEVYVQYNLSADGTYLELGKLGGFPQKYTKILARLELGQAVCGTVALTRQPIYVNDVQQSDDRKVRLIRSLGIGTYACHPLIVDGRLLGTLSFGSRSLPRFDPATIDLLKTFCSLVAHALARREQERTLQQDVRSSRRKSARSGAATSAARPALMDCLSGGEELGELMRGLDWAQTPLGPVASWPSSLRTSVSTCLNSRFPILLWWGPDLIMLYNDAYRPILGSKKHPAALGQPGRECWPEIWHIIGPMLEGVLNEGRATWSEDQLLILDRNVTPEECYFTFSYSPIQEEGQGTAGVFTAVTETTRQVVSERRMATLQHLTQRTSILQPVAATGRTAVECLAQDPDDIPFALLYLHSEAGADLRLVGSAGLPPGCSACLDSVPAAIQEQAAGWPFHLTGESHHLALVDDLPARFPDLDIQVHGHPVRSALILPVTRSSQESPYGYLVSGLSPIRPYDPGYESFLNLVAGQVAAGVANALALQEEHRRAEELAKLDRAKTEFFSNISHEFRTPLTLMLGPIQEALAEPESIDTLDREILEMVNRNGLRLLKLINTLLDFSRIEAGRVEAVYEPTDLALLTTDLSSAFRSAIERAGLRLNVECQPLGEMAYVDREMWEKIVLNLLSNALKFTFTGEITVILQSDGQKIELIVSDTGIGIEEQDRAHIFERFYRGHTHPARTQEGSGIGLALVRELVHLHGGTIEVASQPGQSSTFTVCIPAGKAHLPAERISATRTLSSTALGAAPYVDEALHWLPDSASPADGMAIEYEALARVRSSQPGHLLVVDDNADMRAYLHHLLSPYWTVDTVPDGQTALEAMQVRLPDLVLADVMMPYLNGLELLNAMRQDPRLVEVPVILLSARAGEEARLEGLEAGADDYLIKPFTARELLARIEARLELRALRSTSQRQITTILRELELSNKELEDFALIASHDLQEPLRKIEAFGRQVLNRAGPALGETERDYLERMQSAAARMRKIITDLLVLARITSEGRPFTQVNLKEVAQTAVDDLEMLVNSTSGVVEIGDLPVLQADPLQMLQLLQNLIGNGLKFHHPHRPPHVQVTATLTAGDQVEICVADNGAGFDMRKAGRLFQPFQRLHGRSEYDGTGIGLSICRKIVERHGGSIRAESQPGQGATFFVRLPLSQGIEERRGDPHPSPLPYSGEGI